LFDEAGCKVVIVSFGTSQGAESWLRETGTSLDLYLDPDRRVYSLFGLDRSVSKVWRISTIQYYAAQKCQGRKLPQAISGNEDDPLQMGGDFTIDKNLKRVMCHPSSSPTDRPSVEQILQAL